MRPARLLCAAAAALLAAGCAVHSNPGKPLSMRVDQAEVFGKDAGELRLPDGGVAKLRLFQGRYSVKFTEYQRVIEIDKATSVRFVGAQQFGDRTLVVLEKSERNCAFKTQLLSIKGREVRAWDFGNCQSAPRIDATENEALFDLPHRRGTTRYIYSDGELRYGELRGAPGEANTSARSQASARPQAPADAAPAPSGRSIAFPLPAPSAPEPAAEAAPALAPVPGKPASPARNPLPGSVALPKRAADLDFPTRQQAPQTLYIDR